MQEPRTWVRRGFTLIELLVVIAIIAILIGLLVPAVQKVREAAALTQCNNQMKQLALACHGYHDVNKKLPQNYGGVGGWNANSQAWSWIAMILPYIEQGNLYTNGNIGAMTNGVPTSTISQQGGAICTAVIPVLRCPSDPQASQLLFTDRADVGGAAGSGVSISNYKGVCGANWEWGNGLWNPGLQYPATDQNGLDNGNGVLYRSNGTTAEGYPVRAFTLLSITDGTSNTFLIGEDLPSLSQWCGSWAYANNVSGTCAIYLNANQTAGLGINEQNATNGDWPDNYGFGSGHTAGANFAYADGHVSFVTNSIAMTTTYRYLSTMRGGEVVSPP
jgi:prepilin-type N-terminal cleavage/methylation domain-containing protein/prepilin-type processing-associated H-X9-DG protein